MARYSWRSGLGLVDSPEALVGLAQRFLDDWSQEEIRLLPPGAWPVHPRSLDDIVRASVHVQCLAARYLEAGEFFLLKELAAFLAQVSIAALRLPDPQSAPAWNAHPEDLG